MESTAEESYLINITLRTEHIAPYNFRIMTCVSAQYPWNGFVSEEEKGGRSGDRLLIPTRHAV